jgi:hypothetical protein
VRDRNTIKNVPLNTDGTTSNFKPYLSNQKGGVIGIEGNRVWISNYAMLRNAVGLLHTTLDRVGFICVVVWCGVVCVGVVCVGVVGVVWCGVVLVVRVVLCVVIVGYW